MNIQHAAEIAPTYAGIVFETKDGVANHIVIAWLSGRSAKWMREKKALDETNEGVIVEAILEQPWTKGKIEAAKVDGWDLLSALQRVKAGEVEEWDIGSLDF